MYIIIHVRGVTRRSTDVTLPLLIALDNPRLRNLHREFTIGQSLRIALVGTLTGR